MIDTVERAAATPDEPQPYADLGLAPDEYARIRDILQRRPTAAELMPAMSRSAPLGAGSV